MSVAAEIRYRFRGAVWHRAGVIALIGLAVAANLAVVALIIYLMIHGQNEQDWNIYREASRRAWSGLPLYDWTYPYEFRYSPLFAYLVPPLSIVGWRLVSLASLLLLPKKLALIALISLPLWLDLYAGNTMTLIFVLAVLAVSGRGWATFGFLEMALLIPRPIMLPVLVWLLWKRPEWRLRFAAMIAVNLGLVLLSGHADGWLHAFAGRSDLGSFYDFGPARLIGVAWVPIGLALAAFLTWKGRLGYASLAASPYWLAYYPLMLLLELSRPGDRSASPPTPTGSLVSSSSTP